MNIPDGPDSLHQSGHCIDPPSEGADRTAPLRIRATAGVIVGPASPDPVRMHA